MSFNNPPTAEQLQARKDWVSALRSGQYKQGVSTLYNIHHDSYCCLGVACAINDHVYPLGANLENYPSVMKKLGINKNPRVGGLGLMTVAELNDNGHSFEDIASRIENALIKPYENNTTETA